MQNNNVDISVYMLTYYHEKYIAQAIESVLSQNTHYSYEIVICDDCSKDGTREILQQYAEQYPNKIRVILNKENMGIPRNIFQARSQCRGRYIVGLSGDDYWINNSKLEIEGMFLDEHPEYIAVFNGIELRYDDSNIAYDTVPKPNERNREFTIKDYEKGGVLRSHGFMMRNFFLDPEERAYFKQAQEISDRIDDAVDVVLIMKKGRVFILDVVTDAHRISYEEKSTKHNYNAKFSRIEKFHHYINLVNRMDEHFNKDRIEVEFEKKYIGALITAEIDMVLSRQYKEYHQIFMTIPERYRKPLFKSVYIKSIPEIFKFGYKRVLNTTKRVMNKLSK